MYQSKQFIKDLQLAELLALQQPLFQQLYTFRAGDIQFDPHKDYRQLLKDEFTTNKQKPQLQTKLIFTLKPTVKLQNLKVVALDFNPVDERLLLAGYSS